MLRGIVKLHLGVPLHRDARRVRLVLHSLDDAIVRPRDGLQARRQPRDALVVPRADCDLEGAEVVGQSAVRGHSRPVVSMHSLGQAMLDGAAAEIREMRERADMNLAASAILERALKTGDRVPDFRLPDARGGFLRLKDLLGAGPVVLSFYRGGWCPYCNLELQALQ